MSQCHTKAVSIQRLPQMQPTNAASFSLFLEDTLTRSLAAINCPRFIACLKKKKEKGNLNVSVGFILVFHSFEYSTPDMLYSKS